MRNKPTFTVSLLTMSLLGCSGKDPNVDLDDDPEGGADASDDSPEPELVCARLDESLATIEPTILFVVDRSGSMTSNFGSTSRWNAVYGALMDPNIGVIPQLNSNIRFGLALFSSNNGNAGGTCPVLDTVAPATNNAAAIDAVYAAASPAGDTPTGTALVGATAVIGNATGPRFLILATDGMPDTCEIPNPDGLPAAQAAAVDATTAAFDAGIGTFVLSVGNGVSDAHLQDVANAGAGLTGDLSAPYYVANDPAELSAAINGIVSDARECSFAIELDVGLVDTGEGFHVSGGRVTLDGRALARDSEWRMIGNDTLRLVGPACDEVRDGGDHRVEAELTCDVTVN